MTQNNLEGVMMEAAKCQFCNDTGWYGYSKPMTGRDGRTVMVYVPQTCSCAAGENFRNNQVIVATVNP